MRVDVLGDVKEFLLSCVGEGVGGKQKMASGWIFIQNMAHLCFKQAQPEMCHSPKVDD